MPRKPAPPPLAPSAVRVVTAPEPGFYAVRMVRGGPQVAALIYRPCPFDWYDPDIDPDATQAEPYEAQDRVIRRPLRAEIDGRPADPDRVWTSGRRIPRNRFLYLRDLAAWARRHAPDDPAARPTERLPDPAAIPSVY
jgi:hypothetical protein